MGDVLIHGASDDLIEMSGDVYEEWCDTKFGDGALIRLSTGDVIETEISSVTGAWEVKHAIKVAGSVMTDVARPDDPDVGDRAAQVSTADPIEWAEVKTTKQRWDQARRIHAQVRG